MLICWFLSSFVSDISAMLALVAFRSDSMLLTLLLMPLTLTVIMVTCLFFSDSGPFVFPWSVQVAFFSCWDYLDVGGSKCYFLFLLVVAFVGRWRTGSVGVSVVYSGSGFVDICLSGSGLFISGSGLFWFLLCFFSFWLPGVGLWFCRGCVYLVGFCFLSGVCDSSPFRPCCVVFCVWMSFYFCCCGEVGGFHSCGVFSGHSGPCLVCALCGFRGFSFLVWSFVFYGGGVVVCLLSCRLSSCSLCLLSGVLVLCLFCDLSVVLSGVRGEISTGSSVCRNWHWSPRRWRERC